MSACGCKSALKAALPIPLTQATQGYRLLSAAITVGEFLLRTARRAMHVLLAVQQLK